MSEYRASKIYKHSIILSDSNFQTNLWPMAYQNSLSIGTGLLYFMRLICEMVAYVMNGNTVYILDTRVLPVNAFVCIGTLKQCMQSDRIAEYTGA